MLAYLIYGGNLIIHWARDIKDLYVIWLYLHGGKHAP